ncbi:hypothetical protein [Streptodolium elevatio]|uniref:WxL domain-containing protein n=1 Tax=Streptodolium elevatio TaxID=3157996 RepID=A0ABV3DWR0_9ACTN
MAAGAGLVLAAPPAGAVPVPYTAKCVDPTAPARVVPDAPLDVEITVRPAKSTYRVGDEVTVTWVWKTYPKVPNDTTPASTPATSSPTTSPSTAPSPVPAVVPADSTLPKGQIVVGGAQAGTVAVAGERKNPEAVAGSALKVADMTGTLRLTAAGQVSLAPGDFARFTRTGPVDAETRCTPASPVAVSTVLTVEDDAPAAPPAAATAEPTLAADLTAVAAGGLVTLNGTDWPAGTPEVSLCQADGGGCSATGIAANTVAVADGRLTGTATLDPAAAPGSYALRVKVGTAQKTVPVAVRAVARTVTAAPAAGPVGTVVKLAGAGFTAGRSVAVRALAGDGRELDGGIDVPVGPDGTFTADLPVTDPATTAIRVREGSGDGGTATAAFTVTPGPGPGPEPGTPEAGTLSMTQTGTAVDFGGATLDGTAKTLEASLNQLTVNDTRSGGMGWSLTGTMTDLAHARGMAAIPAGNVSWVPNCAALPGSPSQVTSGAAGPLSSTAAAALCTQSPGAPGGASGGTFTADARLALTTPEFTAAGTYSGTLTLTLV